MKFTNLSEALTFDDVLLIPQYSTLMSRSEADLSWTLDQFKFTVPVIAANMDKICGDKMMNKMHALGGLGIHHRRCSLEVYKQLRNDWHNPPNFPIAVSVGALQNDKERIEWTIQNADIICIDIAHGDSKHMIDTLDFIRDRNFTNPIIAGNVCTPEATRCLLEHGATIVKVGIGPGSVCTTRIKTGCGFPQLSAITNCSEAGPIIADGGIRSPGDIAKALAAGAKAVMIGGMLAGTDCTPGWDQAMIDYNERLAYARQGVSGSTFPEMPLITYRGMASKESKADVNQEDIYSEGVSKTIKCLPTGSTEAVIIDIVSGVKSAMSYSGVHTLKEFTERAKFVRVTSATQIENHPHFKD
jgi:guanosine monophosphate reductase